MKKIIPIILLILILAFPNTVETVVNGIGNLFMLVITPLIEYIGNIAQG